ncbi:MAG: FAD-dependent oxidoreductase, partial [Alistipes sp.]|nr:FAD-dependent oxidoreductase [Alistipes sp.]
DGTAYEADHIILATGARPREMPFMPVDGQHVITSKQALTLTKLPQSMIVVGSGAIGSEFAWFYAALGVKVTVIEYLPRMMPLEDEEVSKTMERAFRKLRATVLTSTTVKQVTVAPDGICHVEIEGKKGPETLTADVVLSAVGIQANIEGIGLETVGVTVERGKIKVDEYYRTNVPGIYAIGDIVGGPALAHVASAEGICCIEHICGLNPEPVDYTTIPSCIFTSPEVASVGLTEEQLRAQGIEYKAGRFPFTASGKATAAGDRDGFIKLLFGADDRLLGAHMVGANVTEMLAEPTLAKMLGATAHRIARTIHAHPTLNEGIMEAAEAALGAAIHL